MNDRIGHILINEHFMKDMERIMRRDILDIGYSEDAIDMEHVIYQFCVLYKRLIHNHPRKIYYADTFVRPTDDRYAAGLDALEAKIRNGENVNPHLSRTTKRINYKDGMLFDWNIYHFHLGVDMEDDNYSGRTGDVLYAYVEEDAMYFLAIAPHGQWEDKQLLEIIVRNWEELLSIYAIDADIEKPFDSKEDIKMFREGNINSMIKLSNGKTYISMGGGFMTNGFSASARFSQSHIMRFVQDLESTAKVKIYESVKQMLKKQEFMKFNYIEPYVYQLALRRINEDRIGIVQIKSDMSEKIVYEHPFPSLRRGIYG